MQKTCAIVPSTRTAMKGGVVVALTVLAGTALANPTTGPVYPLPGGQSVVSSGFPSGQSTGRLNSYTIPNAGSYTEAYWGHWGGTSILGSLQGANSTAPMTLDVGQSNFAGGIGVWTGLSNYTFMPNPFAGMQASTVMTRFTLTTTSGGNPLPLITGASVGVANSDALANITGLGSFEARLRFEAQDPMSGVWTPLVDLYNSYNNNGAGTQTSFNGGFYYSVPTPGAAALLGVGGLIAARRRRAA